MGHFFRSDKFKERFKQEADDNLGICILNQIEFNDRKSNSQNRVIKGWELVAVNHHPDKFDDNRCCNKWDLMFFISHITSHFFSLVTLSTFLNGHVTL